MSLRVVQFNALRPLLLVGGAIICLGGLACQRVLVLVFARTLLSLASRLASRFASRLALAQSRRAFHLINHERSAHARAPSGRTSIRALNSVFALVLLVLLRWIRRHFQGHLALRRRGAATAVPQDLPETVERFFLPVDVDRTGHHLRRCSVLLFHDETHVHAGPRRKNHVILDDVPAKQSSTHRSWTGRRK